jgi:crotonobetainyl-CoA:carnitine CoA-transferase CaiB-like acyl-CoA transferase
MTSYTSGPWKVVGSYISAPSWEGFCKVYRLESDADVAESDANARLIAHAPELVEALEAALGWMDALKVGGIVPVGRRALVELKMKEIGAVLAAIRGDA